MSPDVGRDKSVKRPRHSTYVDAHELVEQCPWLFTNPRTNNKPVLVRLLQLQQQAGGSIDPEQSGWPLLNARRAKLQDDLLTAFGVSTNGGLSLTERVAAEKRWVGVDPATVGPLYDTRGRPRKAPIFPESEVHDEEPPGPGLDLAGLPPIPRCFDPAWEGVAEEEEEEDPSDERKRREVQLRALVDAAAGRAPQAEGGASSSHHAAAPTGSTHPLPGDAPTAPAPGAHPAPGNVDSSPF